MPLKSVATRKARKKSGGQRERWGGISEAWPHLHAGFELGFPALCTQEALISLMERACGAMTPSHPWMVLRE